MNILITGNLGYVGSVLTSSFVEKSSHSQNRINLIGYDLGLYSHKITGNDSVPEKFLMKQIYKDIREITAQDLENIHIVIHLAALSNDPIGKDFESQTDDINFQASKKLFKLCEKSNVKKFIFASSCSVYGFGGSSLKTEDSSLNPLTAYAKSKINFENYLLKKNNKSIEIIILRFSTACGSSFRTRFDLVLNDFVYSALNFNKINILSDGSPLRPLIDVRDMANALIWASFKKFNEPITILNTGLVNCNYSIKELAFEVKKAVPEVRININKKAEKDNRSYKVDFRKFEEISGGKVLRYDIQESIQTLISLIKNNDLKGDMKNFFRLQTLTELIKKNQIDSNIKFK